MGLLRCSFCDSEDQVRTATDTEICGACIRRVVELAVDPTEAIWVDDGSFHESAPLQTSVADGIDTERAVEDFKRGVARQIAYEDAEAHSDLAQAYSEMGLYLDARREAGIAIGSGAATRATDAALRLLLTAPLLRSDGLRRPREALRRRLH